MTNDKQKKKSVCQCVLPLNGPILVLMNYAKMHRKNAHDKLQKTSMCQSMLLVLT